MSQQQRFNIEQNAADAEAIERNSLFVAYCILMVCTLFITPFTAAQKTLTLSQAINNGLANRKNIQAGNSDVTISKLQTEALYRKYWPQVSAAYTYFYNPILQTSILPIGIFNPTYPIDATKSVQMGTSWTQSAGLTAIQPLIDVSIRRQIHEAKLQEKISAVTQAQTEYELAYTIAQTYIDIYLQESKIQSAIADTGRTYISYKLLKNQFDEGRLLKPELNSSKMNHNNAVQLLADGIAQLIEYKLTLLFLMGTQSQAAWDFRIDPAFASRYALQLAVNPLLSDQLPDVQRLVLQSELTYLQARSARAKQIPTVSFKGFIGANQFTNTFNPVAANSWFGQSYIGLDVKIPLLFGENLHNKLLQLKTQAGQDALLKEDKLLEYSKNVAVASRKMENIKSQLNNRAENIMLSTESVSIMQDRFREGQTTASALNTEEINLQLLQANYETNKREWWVYWLDAMKSSGQLYVLWK